MAVELLHIDCMAYMKTLPDNAFDLAIVDPPYGIGFGEFNRTNKDASGNRVKADKYKNSNWDDSAPEAAYFNELKRVSKEQIIWGGNYFLNYLGNSKGMICWYKHQPVDNFSDCEFAWVSMNRPAKVFSFPYYGNIEGNTKASQKLHPTQKPKSLYAWLFRKYAKAGDRILDTHLGSGSSAIVADKMGFDFVGCEIDKEYYDNVVARFNKETDLGMFEAPKKIMQAEIF